MSGCLMKCITIPKAQVHVFPYTIMYQYNMWGVYFAFDLKTLLLFYFFIF